MKTKIVSFGDSFIFGSELKNNADGYQAWPGLIAKDLGIEYKTCAVPGCGNENITRQVLAYFSNNPSDNVLAVINWTWGARWDFYISSVERWITLGLTCVPSRLTNLISDYEAAKVIDFYRTYPGNSTLWDKFRTLQTIYAAQQYLEKLGVPSIQTYMDTELWDQTCHAPAYIKTMQKLVNAPMQSFEGKTFLDWSYHNGFAVTDPGLHPLEDAHYAAANLWKNQYAQILHDRCMIRSKQ
jgi:hypothetical protein